MPDSLPAVPDPLRRNIHWRTFQFIMQNFFCFWLQYRARGIEHLPREGGALLLINHQSFLDPLLVGLPLTRPVSFLARDSLFKVPVVGHILRNTYVMPISRESTSTASIREAIRRMEAGFYVGIFPEGTRTENGSVGTFKPGFLALLRRSKVPVIPVGIAGAYEAYPKGRTFPALGKVRVVYGAAFERPLLESYGKSDENGLLNYVRQRIADCVSEAQGWRDGVSFSSPPLSERAVVLNSAANSLLSASPLEEPVSVQEPGPTATTALVAVDPAHPESP